MRKVDICRLLNIFSLTAGQIILLDKFFDGTFFTYGIEVMSFADRDQEDRIDPMIYVFPRYTFTNGHPLIVKYLEASQAFSSQKTLQRNSLDHSLE